MKAVGYTRVSAEDQVEHGRSLAAQETLIRQFAAGRGWQLVHIYSDPGLSGRRDDRPGLLQLQADAAAGQFDVVIVHAIDRLYRRLEPLLKVLQTLQQNGVTCVSVVENLDFTTPWGKLALAILGTLAEIYIDRLSAETAKGKHQRAREGLWNGSIPLGYCTGRCAQCTDPNGPDYCPRFGGPDLGDGQNLVPHPIEAEAVRLAFEWYATAEYSDGAIAARLNSQRYRWPDGREVALRPKSEAGRQGPGVFTKDTVREVLGRVFYTGLVPYYGTDGQGRRRKRHEPVALYAGRHPALVSQELFARVQEVRRLLRKHPRRRGMTRARQYVLSGVLRCAGCGSAMRGQGGAQGRHYYVCAGRLQHTTGCRLPATPAEQVEEALHRWLLALPVPADWQERLLSRLGHDPQALTRQQAEIRARLARAAELYLAGLLSAERLAQEQREAQSRLQDLTPGEISAIIAVEEQLVRLQQQWDELEALEKKKLLRGVLTAAFVRGDALVAVQPAEQCYPLIKTILGQEEGFYNGDDGGLTQVLVILQHTPDAV